MSEPGSYFNKLDWFFRYSQKIRCGVLAYQFDVDAFIEKTAQPFLHDLIKVIEITFEIPDHLTGSAAFDPVSLP